MSLERIVLSQDLPPVKLSAIGAYDGQLCKR